MYIFYSVFKEFLVEILLSYFILEHQFEILLHICSFDVHAFYRKDFSLNSFNDRNSFGSWKEILMFSFANVCHSILQFIYSFNCCHFINLLVWNEFKQGAPNLPASINSQFLGLYCTKYNSLKTVYVPGIKVCSTRFETSQHSW